MSYRRTNDPSGLEVESSTAGASGGRDLDAPSGLQLDLLTVIVRLEQINGLLDDEQDVFAWDLFTSRVIECDVPRLRGYLTSETLAWEKELG